MTPSRPSSSAPLEDPTGSRRGRSTLRCPLQVFERANGEFVQDSLRNPEPTQCMLARRG